MILVWKSYFKPTEDQILEGNDRMIGYVGVIDDLTINEENRLKKKVQQLTIRSDKLDELHDEVKYVRTRSDKLDAWEQSLAGLSELQKQIDEMNEKLGL
jgi:predicted KAP-like P-loop ATPase